MAEVLVALAPAAAAAVFRYGVPAALLIGASVAAAFLAESLWTRRPATDGSALVTGAIFALVLPANAPLWVALAGGAGAIVFGKQLFGGLGKNPMNPAALARAVLMGLAPACFFAPAWPFDGIAQASPLGKEMGSAAFGLADLALGRHAGSLGEASPFAVLLGGGFLLLRRTMDWRVPLAFLAAVAALALSLPPGGRMAGHAAWLAANPLGEILSGGTLVAAFFMLTDPVGSPFFPSGRVIAAVLAATYMMIARYYTPYPDAAALAVLLANAASPLIDRLSVGRAAFR